MTDGLRTVTVFDADLPPGVAFLRSLARAGVAVVVGVAMFATAGRFSQHAFQVRRCPSMRRTDEFVEWLGVEIERGAIDLVAPTSDDVSFCVAEAFERAGRKPSDAGHPDAAAVRTTLFKDAFATAMTATGFPTPDWAAPTSVDEASEAAQAIGYPVVLKPRTHAGVGGHRGLVVRSADELAAAFGPYALRGASTVLAHDRHAALPIVQRYHELGTVDVVSITGCLDDGGALRALGHCRKLHQSPRRLGVGTMFEPIDAPWFSDAAVDAVRQVLGSGPFELEVLVDRTTGEHWAIDLNPRGFGQISLDLAQGNDLPRLWYESVTGADLPVAPRAASPTPQRWHDGAATYAELAYRLARGPQRAAAFREARELLGTPRVGAMYERRDPVPGIVYGLQRLRHPRALVEPTGAPGERSAAPGRVPAGSPLT